MVILVVLCVVVDLVLVCVGVEGRVRFETLAMGLGSLTGVSWA